ncbi:hypothetical protein EJ08DRAFT_663074 [Tothia fuscella]|uniref:Uncharacterized protein n=1 Tax=Tothia fuscella TaxID=1048955 RepID=A0A9P4TVU5_9PEZI|nr:hypothetical protein EJ08DRAFT_663074 [Tothia fuscella]
MPRILTDEIWTAIVFLTVATGCLAGAIWGGIASYGRGALFGAAGVFFAAGLACAIYGIMHLKHNTKLLQRYYQWRWRVLQPRLSQSGHHIKSGFEVIRNFFAGLRRHRNTTTSDVVLAPITITPATDSSQAALVISDV